MLVIEGLQIIPKDLLEQYKTTVNEEALFTAFNQLEDSPLSTEEFSFYTSVAAVYSSKIEGEAIELDSYIKHKRFHIEFQPDYTRKIDDLYIAYQFASENRPDKKTFRDAFPFSQTHCIYKLAGKVQESEYVCNDKRWTY